MATVKALKQSMFDEFEIKGYWWVPGSEKQVPGILFYCKEKIRLELLGSFNEIENALENKDNYKDIILGVSDKGEEFTLISAYNQKYTFNIPGYPTETYIIEAFIVGGHFNSREEIHFHSVTITLTYLTKWLQKAPFKQEFIHQEKVLKEARVKFIPPSKIFEMVVPSIKSTIREEYNTNFSGNLNEVKWTFESRIKVIPDDWQTLEWFRDKLFWLRNLFALFIGYPTYFEKIIFYGEENREKYSWFFCQKRATIREKIGDFVIRFNEIETSLSTIIDSWFAKRDIIETMCELYINNFYFDIYLEANFLNYVQAIEIYHRRVHDGKIIDEKAYEEYANKVNQFIKDNLPNILHERLQRLIHHGNEYSLNKRFKEIFESLSSDTKELLCLENGKQRKKFIKQVVEKRNTLVHGDKEGKKCDLDNIEKLYYASERLKVLITILLFKEIGIDEKIIVKGIKNNRRLLYSLIKSKEIL